MRPITLRTCRTLALVVAGMLGTGPALADKPAWAGGDKDRKHERKDDGEGRGKQRDQGQRSYDDRRGREVQVRGHFDERRRVIVHDYYVSQFRTGRCPPGLAKKHNGCMPPGQARKWAIGRPLPRDVVYYDLPPALVVELGRPPAGYRYVRVATDVLLIAVGTGMVVDALQDLGGM